MCLAGSTPSLEKPWSPEGSGEGTKGRCCLEMTHFTDWSLHPSVINPAPCTLDRVEELKHLQSPATPQKLGQSTWLLSKPSAVVWHSGLYSQLDQSPLPSAQGLSDRRWLIILWQEVQRWVRVGDEQVGYLQEFVSQWGSYIAALLQLYCSTDTPPRQWAEGWILV